MTLKTAVSNILLREVSQEEANNFALEEQEALRAYLRYETYSLNFRRRISSKTQPDKPSMKNLEALHSELIDYDDILFDPTMQQYFK